MWFTLQFLCPESFLTHENPVWELKLFIVLRVQQYLISICSASGHCVVQKHIVLNVIIYFF